MSKRKEKSIFSLFLKSLGVKHTDGYSNKLYNEHPHKYNLFGLSKMLSDYNIENSGIKISNKEETIHELETPFIAHIGSDFVVVYKITSEKVFCIWNKKDLNVSIKEFCKMWSGVVLYAEPDEYSVEPDYKIHRNKEVFAFIQKITFLSVILLILFIGFIKNDLYRHVEYYLLALINLAEYM